MWGFPFPVVFATFSALLLIILFLLFPRMHLIMVNITENGNTHAVINDNGSGKTKINVEKSPKPANSITDGSRKGKP